MECLQQVCPKRKSLSVFPPHLYQHLLGNRAALTVTQSSEYPLRVHPPGDRLPAYSSLVEGFSSFISNWATRLGPHPTCAGLCTDPRIAVSIQPLLSLEELYLQGSEPKIHVFHDAVISLLGRGPREMYEYVTRTHTKSIHSNILNSQNLETTQINIKSRMDK